MMKVQCIGITDFRGVPNDLCDDIVKAQIEKGQDSGSNPARLIECSGRTCYDSYNTGRDSANYHDNIKKVGHGSVTEHVHINFFISGVSRGLTHELVRHRHSNFSQRSTRYVDESESPWALHPLIEKHCSPEALANINQLIELAKREYRSVVEDLQEKLTNAGTDKFTARKQARGAARGLLGNALTSELVFTCNIRSLRNFLEQRCSPHADAEIRIMANLVYEVCMKEVPEYFNDYVKVACPDGIGFGLTTPYRKI